MYSVYDFILRRACCLVTRETRVKRARESRHGALVKFDECCPINVSAAMFITGGSDKCTPYLSGIPRARIIGAHVIFLPWAGHQFAARRHMESERMSGIA